MEALLTANSSLETLFEQFLSNRKETNWITNLRKSAFSKFVNCQYPDSNLEAWRKVNLSNFSLHQILSLKLKKPLYSINSELIQVKDFSNLSAEEIVYIQNNFKILLDKYKSSFFELLNLTFFDIGLFAIIPENVNIIESILLDVNYPEGESSFNPLILWKIGKSSKSILYQKFNSNKSDEFNFINPLTYVSLEENVQLTFVSVEDFQNSTFHFGSITSLQNRNSNLDLFHFNLGGYKGKTFIVCDLMGESAYLKVTGASTLNKREIQDIEFTISHFASRTDSQLKFKVVVKDKSHHVFTGNLIIPKDSFHVTASQVNNNLALTRTARAESMPKLEVFAEDVKCSHGATVGEVNEEQLFYLMSRGLTENEARFLIIEGFLKEILDLITLEEIQSLLISRLTEKLYN